MQSLICITGDWYNLAWEVLRRIKVSYERIVIGRTLLWVTVLELKSVCLRCAHICESNSTQSSVSWGWTFTLQWEIYLLK